MFCQNEDNDDNKIQPCQSSTEVKILCCTSACISADETTTSADKRGCCQTAVERPTFLTGNFNEERPRH